MKRDEETKKTSKMAAKKRKKFKNFALFALFLLLYISLESNLFVFCEVILYILSAHKNTRNRREREKFERERGTCWRFFLSSSSVTVLLLCRLDGERERVILNFRSFVRCFPIASSSSRDETRERQYY